MLIVKIAKPAKVRIGSFPDASTSPNAPSHPARLMQINLPGNQLSELRGGVVDHRHRRDPADVRNLAESPP